MHIPDGYLGPLTYLGAYGIMAPTWAWASHEVRRTLDRRRLPAMALGAGFSFTIMMFNIPIPGGTSGHAVGSVLVAVLLGPWAAVIAVSVALAVQALLFGDGGVTALGANCLNMAVLMPFAGWWTYRLIAGKSPSVSKRRWFAAALGGYVGLNVAAMSAALMFGMQPALAHDARGRPLYCPFSLEATVPAMAFGHLLLFGVVEAAATGLVFAYLSKSEPALVDAALQKAASPAGGSTWRKLVLGLGVLLLLTPLGLYLPAKLGAGEAWGEWGGERLGRLAGYVPAGFQRLKGLWHAPMPGYAPNGPEGAPFAVLSGWYIMAGALGACIVAGALMAARRWLLRREANGKAP